jgi:hypothetical protein
LIRQRFSNDPMALGAQPILQPSGAERNDFVPQLGVNVSPVCGCQNGGGRREELLLFDFDLPLLVSNEAACGVIKGLARNPLLVENLLQSAVEVAEARCGQGSFRRDIVDYSGTGAIPSSRQIEHELFSWMVILIQERSEKIDHFAKKLVVRSLRAAKQIAFLLEGTENIFDVSVIATQGPNDCSHGAGLI